MHKLLSSCLIMGLICGCAMTQNWGGAKGTEGTEGDAAPQVEEGPPPNSYYYYAEAHVKKKEGQIGSAIELMKKAVENDPGSLFLHVELASFYLLLKDSGTALAIIDQVLEADGEYVPALLVQARTLHALKKTEDAKQSYEKIIAIDPMQQEVYLLLGTLYADTGEYEKALAVYKKLVRYFPASYAGHFFIGKIMVEQGKEVEAEKAFKRTLELAPELEEPRMELIRIYEARGDDEQLKGLYEELLDGDPGNIQAAAGLGYLLHKSGKKREAEKVLKDLGRQSEADDDVIRVIIKEYLNEEKYAQGVVILEGMLKGAPESDFLLYVLGVAYSESGEAGKSITQLKKVPPDSEVYQKAAIHIALLYQEQGELDKAIAHLEKVLDNVSDNPEFFLYLGWFHEDKGNFEDAERILEQGLAIDPDNSELLFRLGVIYDKWGKKEASIDTMKRVILIDPENANALNYLGYTYADMGENLDEAEELVKRALSFKPDDGYITDSLGWIYYKKGQYEKALPLLQKAVELVPDDPIILEHMGDVYHQLGDREKALKFYKESRQHQEKDGLNAIQKKIDLMKTNDKP